MLVKHSIIYFLSRVFPSVLNFLAFAIYTRMVSPEQYGYYAIAFASILLLNNILFQWLRLGLLRFLPKHQKPEDRQMFLSSILKCYVMSIGIFLLIFFAIYLVIVFTDSAEFGLMIILSAVILIIYGWFEATLELIRSSYNPNHYGYLFLSKSILVIITTTSLCYLGLGAYGLLTGILVGQILPLSYFTIKYWKGVSLKKADSVLVKKILVYGLPLSVTSLMVFILDASDRILIGLFLDSSAAGLYAVGYDLAKQSIWILMLSVNLASFPLAVKALEHKGKESALIQLKSNFILLSGIAIPGSIGLILVSKEISQIFLGSDFSGTAMILIPLITLGVLLAGFKSYYFDQSFQLGEKTLLQFWPVFVGAMLNILLNIWWIPLFGIVGAAYSTIVSFAISLALSIVIGQKVFKLPIPVESFLRILASGFIMGLVINPIDTGNSLLDLVLKVLIGIITYSIVLFALTKRDTKNHIRKILKIHNGYKVKTN